MTGVGTAWDRYEQGQLVVDTHSSCELGILLILQGLAYMWQAEFMPSAKPILSRHAWQC